MWLASRRKWIQDFWSRKPDLILSAAGVLSVSVCHMTLEGGRTFCSKNTLALRVNANANVKFTLRVTFAEQLLKVLNKDCCCPSQV